MSSSVSFLLTNAAAAVTSSSYPSLLFAPHPHRSSSHSPRFIHLPPISSSNTKSICWNRRRYKRVIMVSAASSAPKSDDSPDSSSSSNPTNGNENTPPKSRKDFLLEYVNNVKPEFLEVFTKRAPKHVVDAMRQTVTNMIGTLPPQFFSITVTTVAENLAQLMYSVMMTGYMFKNAQFRLELQQSLEHATLPNLAQDEKVKDATSDYAPGTQKKVVGEVIRWNKASGAEKIEAEKYIELLEAEIEELKHQVSRRSTNGENQLLEYLKSLEPQNLKELTTTAGEDAVFAMNTFTQRLLGVSDPSQMKATASVTDAPELAKMLYWLMVVGYSIRNIEVRFDMERVLGAPEKLAELPPGETI